MQKLFKWLATSLLSTLTLLALGAIYITVAVDPNHFKPQIETAAQQAGVELSIKGDLEWQFLPIGITVNQVDYSLQDKSIAGHIDQLALGVDLLALIPPDNQQIPIDSLSIQDGRLFVALPDQLPIQITQINLDIRGASYDGTPFPVSLSMQVFGGKKLSLNTELGIVFANRQVTDFSVSQLDLRLDALKLSGDVQTTEHLSHIQGDIRIHSFNLLDQLNSFKQFVPNLQLPEMANPQALNAVSVDSRFNLELSQTSEVQTVLVIDNQSFDINVLIDQPNYSLTTLISADSLNLNHYLSQSSDDSNNAALFAPLAIPLALWHGKSQVEFSLEELVISDFSLNNIYTDLYGYRNVFSLRSFNADVFDGQINAVAELDLSNPEAKFNLQTSIDGINLGEALASASDSSDLLGVLNLDADIQGSGNYPETLIESLNGNGQLEILSPQLTQTNLEQSLCTAAALFGGGQSSSQQWSQGTQLWDFKGDFQLNRGRLIISDYQTGTGHIAASGSGSLNLLNQSYSIKNTLLADKPTTSSNGCSINKNLQNRPITLRCDGKMGESPNCRPDENMLKLFFKDRALNPMGLGSRISPLKELINKRLNPKRQ